MVRNSGAAGLYRDRFKHSDPRLFCAGMGFASLYLSYNALIFVGWVERSETHPSSDNCGGCERLNVLGVAWTMSG